MSHLIDHILNIWRFQMHLEISNVFVYKLFLECLVRLIAFQTFRHLEITNAFGNSNVFGCMNILECLVWLMVSQIFGDFKCKWRFWMHLQIPNVIWCIYILEYLVWSIAILFDWLHPYFHIPISQNFQVLYRKGWTLKEATLEIDFLMYTYLM